MYSLHETADGYSGIALACDGYWTFADFNVDEIKLAMQELQCSKESVWSTNDRDLRDEILTFEDVDSLLEDHPELFI